MLVLTRKSRESVVVGGDDGLHRLLKVTVLEIGAGRVKLGFDVDADVPVHRSEVWERIRAMAWPNNLPDGPALIDRSARFDRTAHSETMSHATGVFPDNPNS